MGRDSAGVCNEKDVPTHDNWREDASEAANNHIMMYVDIGELTGRAYNLSHKMARESQHWLYDSDTNTFDKALRDTLDFAKHGHKIGCCGCGCPWEVCERIGYRVQ